MKKIITVIMALVLGLSMSLSVFAAPGSFLVSPGTKFSPVLVEGVINDCEGVLVITPYAERHNLPDNERKQLEDAYGQFRDNENLSNLVSGLNKNSNDNERNVTRYAISELFYTGYQNCDDHDGHNNFRAVLKLESTKNFAALLTLVNGVWTVVEDVEVDGDHLIVNGNYYGPYAIAMNTGSGDIDNTVNTGDSFPWIYVVLMSVSAIGLVVLAVVHKKNKAT